MNAQRLRLSVACAVALFPGVALSQAVVAQTLRAPSHIEGTPAGTIMTRDHVEMVGRLAYLWGSPLVNNLGSRFRMMRVDCGQLDPAR
jgi:hypothetical protein